MTYTIGGYHLTPTELSALLLTKLRKDFETRIGPAKSAVVTVPANFNNDQREATLAAIRSAGLTTEALVNEPTAAALYYAFTTNRPLDGTYVVYDLGGGTFDVTVLRAQQHDITVLASEGVQQLGGKDFDEKITALIAKKFTAQTGRPFDLMRYGWSMLDAEELKKSLSQLQEKKVRTVTRAEFEEAISSLIAQTELLCETVLEEAGVTPEQVTDVFLAGGSSRIPLVSKTITTLFRREPQRIGNPDEAIALGAALYAGLKANPTALTPLQRETVSGVTFQEVAPYFFGTIVQDSRTLRDKNSIIIPKNTPIPTERTESYYTVSDNQTEVQCTITQSPQDETDPRFVKVIWEGTLAIPGNRPRGQKVNVTFAYKENGTMHASFVDVASGRREIVDIAAQSAASSAPLDIDQFLVD
jgi:molecular chaperone DnaK